MTNGVQGDCPIHLAQDGISVAQSRRLVTLMAEAIDRCHLDLNGMEVLTEAATGAYIVTPVMAAMAGAMRVHAVTKTTRWGSADAVEQTTMALARAAGIADRISIHRHLAPDIIAAADIITNSGHLRPLDRKTVAIMKPEAVIPLMYEAWEYRPGDVDLAACAERGIRVAGTNERHPAVDVFAFLGVMAVRILIDAGVAIHRNRIAVICDNPFDSYIVDGLLCAGATVQHVRQTSDLSNDSLDAILIAVNPSLNEVWGTRQAKWVRDRHPKAIVVQFWGDIDRGALGVHDVAFWPLEAPAAGHMGVLPSSLGPEPVVRLQAGGLKTGEVLVCAETAPPEDLAFIQLVDGVI